MNRKQFLEFVEIRTKLASMLPFTFGSLYVFYDKSNKFDFLNFVFMFLSLIFIDMSTTAINNYIDYKKSNIAEFKNNENAIGSEKINLRIAKNVIIAMLSLAIIFGLILTYRTNLIVLSIGAVSFLIGITYTYGPTPISRTPYGEVVSGFVMGFIILFLGYYIHVTEVAEIVVDGIAISISFNYKVVLSIFVISIPYIISIGNVMLANNICDLEMDRRHNRLLLPHYIGKEKAIKIFEINYYVAYIAIVVSLITGILPLTMVLMLITIPLVRKNIVAFKKEQIKSKTFICAVKNLMIIGSSYVLTLALGVLIG